jgi:hypothetical protein
MADVKYIKFGDSGAPQLKIDASLSNEEIKDLLKSEKNRNRYGGKRMGLQVWPRSCLFIR